MSQATSLVTESMTISYDHVLSKKESVDFLLRTRTCLKLELATVPVWHEPRAVPHDLHRRQTVFAYLQCLQPRIRALTLLQGVVPQIRDHAVEPMVESSYMNG